jgi:signal transduction histidine kinase
VEMVDRIFDPFFTTKPEGTGLGLAITKTIIHDHGGEISVRSEGETGVSFIITLPLED